MVSPPKIHRTVGAHANLGALDFCEKLIRLHYSAAGGPISMKFGRQNIMPISFMIDIETGSRLSIWRMLAFANRK